MVVVCGGMRTGLKEGENMGRRFFKLYPSLRGVQLLVPLDYFIILLLLFIVVKEPKFTHLNYTFIAEALREGSG